MAISQKQLGNIERIEDVTASGSVSTPTDLASLRAIIFNQTTSGISVTLPDPDPITEKPLTLINRGTVSITVSGLIVDAGPAYEIFWDGLNWIPKVAIGVGVVTNTEDSLSVSLDGDGSSSDPVIAEVRISPAPGQAIELTNDGLFVAAGVFAGATRIIYVDSLSGRDTYDGSFRWPVKTFEKAYELADPQDFIYLYPGNYILDDINGPFIWDKEVRLRGFTTDYNASSVIYGHISVQDKLFADEVGIVGVDEGVPTLTMRSSGCVVRNSNIRHNLYNANDPSPETAIQFASGANEEFEFFDGSIGGAIRYPDFAGTDTARLALVGGVNSPPLYLENPRLTTLITNRPTGPIYHSAGILSLTDAPYIRKDTFNYSITSSAELPNSFLSVRGSSTFQQDGTFGLINKSGDCPFLFDSVTRDVANDVLVGLQLRGIAADDINGNYSPDNYFILGQDIRSHLAGIDAALANMQTNVASQDTVTVDLSGDGSSGSPIRADVRISTNPGNAIVSTPSGLFVTAQRIVEIINPITKGWIANEEINPYVVAEGFTLPANLTGSKVSVESSVDFTSTLQIHKNGTSIGSLRIIDSVASFVFTTVTAFIEDDIISFVPDEDAVFDYVTFTLKGTKI